MSYRDRLKAFVARNPPPEQLPKPTKAPSVSFGGSQGEGFCTNDEDRDAIEERAALAADRVPIPYLGAWASLNVRRPHGVSEAVWRQALDDGGLFLDRWGARALETGWTTAELFLPASGLVWRLAASSVERLGADHLRLSDGRTFEKLPP